ncbi:MAG TPA: hypothetical protein VIM57_02025 [Luteolibacter sp.]
MKSFFILCTLIAGTLSAFADITAYKSKGGIVLVSNTPSQHFSIEFKGSKFETLGEGSSPNPMFMVDGQFTQLATIQIKDLKTQTTDETELLKRYLAYETEFYKGQLKDISSAFLKPVKGHPRLIWSATPASSAKVRNVFLVFVHGNYILSLSTAVATGAPEEPARKRLETIAASFKPSDKPITLKFAKDGSYSH